MLRLVDGIAEPTLPQRLRYMADRLGRMNGDTLLAELMPYPRKKADPNAWPYRGYGRFYDYNTYRKTLLPKRLTQLRKLFAMPCKRKLVVAYGKGDWPDFKTLFESAWTKSGPFEYGTFQQTAIVLAHQLGTRTFNSPADLDRFANVAKMALASAAMKQG